MNFYIADTIETININDTNVAIDDDLLDYIYSLNKQIPLVNNFFYSLDPYDDSVIETENVSDIVRLFQYILELKLLKDYDEEEEAIETLGNMIEMGTKAIEKEKKLISIGD